MNMQTLQSPYSLEACSREHESCTNHRVQFYREDRVFVRSAAEFLADSLFRGGIALAFATRKHTDEIRQQLTSFGIPHQQLAEKCRMFDAHEALASFTYGTGLDAARFGFVVDSALREAGAATPEVPVAAFGEMVAVLWAEGKRDAAVQLEHLWNEYLRTHEVPLLCGYPLAYFSQADDWALFSQICSAHSAVIPAEDFVSTAGDDELGRAIAELQQKAEALMVAVEARKLAEERLRTTQAEMESTVDRRTRALRRLSLQVLKLQDLERRRVARELHESLGQDFAGLKLNLDLLRQSPQDATLWQRCDHLIEHCIGEVRTLSNLLHPPIIEDAGFVSAAEWYVRDFRRRTGIEVTFEGRNRLGRLPDRVKVVLFRVLQECLINIYRHARASSAQVLACIDSDHVSLEIADNGIGMPAEKICAFNKDGSGMGVGLTSVWERVQDLGGCCEVLSLRVGTTIRISVPVDSSPTT